MPEGVTATPPPSSSPSRRAAVTVAGVLVVLAGEHLPLPYMDPASVRHLRAWDEFRELAVLGLGLAPLLVAFLFVEVVARFAPPLRRLRHGGPADRDRLTRAAWALGALLAVLQAWSTTIFLQSIPDTGGFLLVDAGWGPALVVTATLSAGALVTGGVAVLISRVGLGNGFAVLLGLGAVQDLVRLSQSLLRAPREQWSEQGLVAGLALLVVAPIVAARLRRREETGDPRIPVPTCSLVVVKAPAEILAFPWRAAAWIPPLAPLAASLELGDDAYVFACIALTLPLAVLLSRLFNAPDAVARAYGRASPGGPTDATAGSVRKALSTAARRSVLLVMGVALFPLAASAMGVPVWVGVESLLALAIVVTVALDLAAEAKARGRDAGLVGVWPLHRVFAVEPVLQALASAGIGGHARALRFRSLFHFFAPYAPIEVLVPRDRAEEAARICAGVAADPALR